MCEKREYNMKRILIVGIALFFVAMNAKAQGQTLFDDGWQFTRNGKTITVNLPHDWDIYEGPNAGKGTTETGGGWYEGGKGEYRKMFKTPKAEVVKLHFEGVYQKAEVFINGHKAGQHAYGYTPFTVDITPYLYKDKRMNEVLVKVNNSEQPNCRWYSGSGIYRHVWLQTMPEMHIAENGILIWTPEVSNKQATLHMNVLVKNKGLEAHEIDDIEVTFRGGSFTLTPQYEDNKRVWKEKYTMVTHNGTSICGLG